MNINRRPATHTEFENMNDLHKIWYLNGVPILLTAKNGITRSMITGSTFYSRTAGQGPHWSLYEADAILVRPKGYQSREETHGLAIVNWPEYVDHSVSTFDPTPYLLNE
jgi:hypothetical protein